MSLFSADYWPMIRRQPPPPPEPNIQIPQFVKDNAYLTASWGVALIKSPKALLLGCSMAIACRLVQSDVIASQSKPLVDRVIEVIRPVVETPMTVADVVALCAMVAFDEFAPFVALWVGFTATLLFSLP